jgi:hypothetical protein
MNSSMIVLPLNHPRQVGSPRHADADACTSARAIIAAINSLRTTKLVTLPRHRPALHASVAPYRISQPYVQLEAFTHRLALSLVGPHGGGRIGDHPARRRVPRWRRWRRAHLWPRHGLVMPRRGFLRVRPCLHLHMRISVRDPEFYCFAFGFRPIVLRFDMVSFGHRNLCVLFPTRQS